MGKRTDICIRLGQRIKSLREKRGWAQVDLSAESGLDRSHISLMENGHIEIGVRKIEILADTFGLTVSQLMRGL